MSAYGYSPRILPFAPDKITGFTQNMTLQQVASQNLINLILCVPGERIMHAGFGVGLRNYLFRMNNSGTRTHLKARIKAQVADYLPYIEIVNISFNGSDIDSYLLKIDLSYAIRGLKCAAGTSRTIFGMSFLFSQNGAVDKIVEYGEDFEGWGGPADTIGGLHEPGGGSTPLSPEAAAEASGVPIPEEACYNPATGYWSHPDTHEETAFDEDAWEGCWDDTLGEPC